MKNSPAACPTSHTNTVSKAALVAKLKDTLETLPAKLCASRIKTLENSIKSGEEHIKFQRSQIARLKKGDLSADNVRFVLKNIEHHIGKLELVEDSPLSIKDDLVVQAFHYIYDANV